MHPRGGSGKAQALRTLGELLWAQAVAAAVAPGGVPPPLEIHVVPHSHCDAGYKKTFDGYLGAEVSSILSSVTQALDADQKRKFIWSESSFLEGWLRGGAGEGEAEVFRGLVTAGQCEGGNRGGRVDHARRSHHDPRCPAEADAGGACGGLETVFWGHVPCEPWLAN